MRLYFYEVNYIWEEISPEEKISEGILSAKNYLDAVQKLLDYYEEQNVMSFRIEESCYDGLVEISHEEIERMKEEQIW